VNVRALWEVLLWQDLVQSDFVLWPPQALAGVGTLHNHLEDRYMTPGIISPLFAVARAETCSGWVLRRPSRMRGKEAG